jgi:hypothetical protein
MNFERICPGFRSVLLEAQGELMENLPDLGQLHGGHAGPNLS